METVEYTIESKRGETLDRTWTIEQQDSNGVWQPVDLTGSTAILQVRDQATEAGALILELSTANGGLTLGNGTIRRQVTAAASGAIPVGNYYYDLAVKTGAVVDYYFTGPWVHGPRVTIVP